MKFVIFRNMRQSLILVKFQYKTARDKKCIAMSTVEKFMANFVYCFRLNLTQTLASRYM